MQAWADAWIFQSSSSLTGLDTCGRRLIVSAVFRCVSLAGRCPVNLLTAGHAS